ncbi:hypothetical protein F7725_009435 [Dissostichus mawsoni]|uniref:Uncharacterized protein n=1 Tax=Dissostichus mawsoni TaxID=36200 RepID=A0A7J5XM54_DISMA|nr:hypothetical protein F7725_009435 [Dissostichus mawsoni]
MDNIFYVRNIEKDGTFDGTSPEHRSGVLRRKCTYRHQLRLQCSHQLRLLYSHQLRLLYSHQLRLQVHETYRCMNLHVSFAKHGSPLLCACTDHARRSRSFETADGSPLHGLRVSISRAADEAVADAMTRLETGFFNVVVDCGIQSLEDRFKSLGEVRDKFGVLQNFHNLDDESLTDQCALLGKH